MLSSLSKGYGSWTAGQVDPYYGEKYVSICSSSTKDRSIYIML